MNQLTLVSLLGLLLTPCCCLQAQVRSSQVPSSQVPSSQVPSRQAPSTQTQQIAPRPLPQNGIIGGLNSNNAAASQQRSGGLPGTDSATLQGTPGDSSSLPNQNPGANNFDLDGLGLDDLNLDASSQAFDFGDDDFAPIDSQDLQSSIASNSNFQGASPQMIGDFGGGSTMFSVGGFAGINFPVPNSNSLSVPIPFAGGARRVKIAENNQVLPTNRIYATFNYFHNSNQVIGTLDDGMLGAVSQVDSSSTVQYTFGIERTLFDDLFSVDVRMPFSGGVDQAIFNPGSAFTPLEAEIFAASGAVGNLSVTLKTYLLSIDDTFCSAGLSISTPTGSGVEIDAVETDNVFGTSVDLIDIDNDAVHLAPFIGLYRAVNDSWWLQGFAQVDVPTNGNEVRSNGAFRGVLTEQTLLYADISAGKWLYRAPRSGGNSRARGITSLASIIELHYTTALNDADGFSVADFTGTSYVGSAGPGFENRFDVLNLTLGLQAELAERWRLNVAGVLPLREGRFVDFEGRREDRFFDGELAVQLNRLY